MIKRVVLGVIAVAMLAAAAGTAVVAAAFGLYALLQPSLGSAGAAGALVGALAVLMAALALLLWLLSKPKLFRRKPKAGSGDPIESLLQMARERPIIATGAIIAAAAVALRNPAVAMMVAKSMFDSKKRKA